MKPFYFLVLFFTIALNTQAQTDSTKPPYLEIPGMPYFKLLLCDSSTFFYRDNLKKNSFTVLVYFSPDCEHCIQQTNLFVNNIKQFKNTQIIMATPLPFEMMKKFYDSLQLKKYPSIIVGRDVLYFFHNYFRNRFIPMIALYDKKQKFIKAWEGGVKVEELLSYIK